MLNAVFINAVLILLLVPIMGHVGAAWATTASLIAWNLLAWRDTRRLLATDTTIFSIPVNRLPHREGD